MDDLNQTHSEPSMATTSDQPYYHGTQADLKVGDLIEPGRISNYGTRRTSKYVYFSATMDAAAWGAELAQGEGRGRVYVVEPTAAFVDDPNLTDKKFPGNPTKSYRSAFPLRVTGEVVEWQGHAPEAVQTMKDKIRASRLDPIED